jgi:hypothetical protein
VNLHGADAHPEIWWSREDTGFSDRRLVERRIERGVALRAKRLSIIHRKHVTVTSMHLPH